MQELCFKLEFGTKWHDGSLVEKMVVISNDDTRK